MAMGRIIDCSYDVHMMCHSSFRVIFYCYVEIVHALTLQLHTLFLPDIILLFYWTTLSPTITLQSWSNKVAWNGHQEKTWPHPSSDQVPPASVSRVNVSSSIVNVFARAYRAMMIVFVLIVRIPRIMPVGKTVGVVELIICKLRKLLQQLLLRNQSVASGWMMWGQLLLRTWIQQRNVLIQTKGVIGPWIHWGCWRGMDVLVGIASEFFSCVSYWHILWLYDLLYF